MQQATSIVEQMVTKFAMYPEIMSFSLNENKFISNYFQNEIDKKIKSILSERLEIVKAQLITHKKELLLLSDQLMKLETIEGEEAHKIVGL